MLYGNIANLKFSTVALSSGYLRFISSRLYDDKVKIYQICTSCHQCRHYHFKKDISPASLPKAFKPKEIEKEWYDWWDTKGYFLPKPGGKSFTLILPPPNVTGNLHLGHALTGTIEDILARWKRMEGETVQWIPGVDHAGIATQAVVEKQLMKELKKSKHDIGRDEFVKQVWKWKQEKGTKIEQQLRQMGFSMDWKSHVFTMDSGPTEAVTNAFIRLFDAGLIYRADALVNWCCALQSSISDIEVEYLDVPGRTLLNLPGCKEPVEFGVLSEIAYRIQEEDGEVVVATTRPETMLGDTAVALHPEDPRRHKLEGKSVWHPFRCRPIPIIFDSFVDRNFGTGAVKITPAHDPTDWQVAKRHNLEIVSVFDESGTVLISKFAGKQRYEVRKLVVAHLKNIGLLRDVRKHPMQIPVCSRTRDVVELVVRPQWFLNCKSAAVEAVDAVRNGDLEFVPSIYNKNWFHWLENIRDWNISRQLWWGHRIPAYEVSVKGQGEKSWVAAINIDDARRKAAVVFGVREEQISDIRQEEDVLDTWFSSGIFPLYSLGWPNCDQDFWDRYPISLMDTGHDILFYWVARMVMMGIMLTGRLPFHKALLHGIICDGQGRKMSKSLGNVISPEDVINGATLPELEQRLKESHKRGLLTDAELRTNLDGQKKLFPNGIPNCGVDALRFTLCSQAIQNSNITFDVSTCNTNKLFCNKILQAFRFFILTMENENNLPSVDLPRELVLGFDAWILSRLSACVDTVTRSLQSYQFHIATSALKQFLYTELCDIYLEATKPIHRFGDETSRTVSLSVLFHCLETPLRLLHPFMPFITEELYQRLPDLPGFSRVESIMIASYPKLDHWISWANPDLESSVSKAISIASCIRKRIALIGIKGVKPDVIIVTTNDELAKFMDDHMAGFKSISKTSIITVKNEVTSFSSSTYVKDVVDDETTVYTNLQSESSIQLESSSSLLQKEKIVRGQLGKLMKALAKDAYIVKTTVAIRERDAEKAEALRSELLKIEEMKKLVK